MVSISRHQGGAEAVHLSREVGRPILRRLGAFEDSGEGLSAALKQFVHQHHLQSTPTISILSSENYQLLQIELADLPAAERPEAARWQIRELLDFPAAEAVIDLFEVAPFGSTKKPLSYVVAAREQLLRDLVLLNQDCELRQVAIDIPEFALRNVADLFTEDERGVALLLLLDQGGIMCLVRDGVLYLARSFNIGMDHLLPYATGNLEALSEQLDQIILEIQRSFDYCESTFQLPMVSRLLVAQTRQEIQAVTSYLNDYLAVPVEPLDLAPVMSLPEETSQLELNRYLLAIGGALRQGQS